MHTIRRALSLLLTLALFGAVAAAMFVALFIRMVQR